MSVQFFFFLFFQGSDVCLFLNFYYCCCFKFVIGVLSFSLLFWDFFFFFNLFSVLSNTYVGP